jgi:hypothetical protein
MSENVFQFDDLFFWQEDGTAMGTSSAYFMPPYILDIMNELQ